MNTADWLILGLAAFSGLIGFWRGFVREILSLAVWVTALALAWMYGPQFANLVPAFVTEPLLRQGLAGLVVFFIVFLLGGFITRFGSGFVRESGLGDTDRLLGVVFGTARGFVILLPVMVGLSFTPLKDEPWWRTSWLVPRLLQAADWSLERLPDELKLPGVEGATDGGG